MKTIKLWLERFWMKREIRYIEKHMGYPTTYCDCANGRKAVVHCHWCPEDEDRKRLGV